MKSDAELLRRWAYAWARTRAMPARESSGLIRVDTDTSSRRVEYVVPDPTPESLDAGVAVVVGSPDVWLTYDARAMYEAPRSALDVVTTAEALMTRSLQSHRDPDGDVVVEALSGVARAHIELDGEVAASGTVGVVGSDAVYDRIETRPAYRRRGLGGRVMAALEAWACTQDATRGILAASAEGQLLYARLGWESVCPLISLRGKPALE